jgi:hypothetical protein
MLAIKSNRPTGKNSPNLITLAPGLHIAVGLVFTKQEQVFALRLSEVCVRAWVGVW